MTFFHVTRLLFLYISHHRQEKLQLFVAILQFKFCLECVCVLSIRTSMRSIFTGMFLLVSLYLLLTYRTGITSAAPGGVTNQETHRPRARTLGRFPRPVQFARIKPDPFVSDFIVDDDDLFELSKRQTSDDYGHLRFGKRGEEIFDDYGHMRFGRSGADK